MKLPNFITLILFSASLFLTIQAKAATKTWTNTSGDFKWSTAANWSGNTVPLGGDDLVFNNGGTPYKIMLVPTFTCTNILVDNNTSVTLKGPTNTTFTINGNISINTSTDSLRLDVISNGITFHGNLLVNGFFGVFNNLYFEPLNPSTWSGTGSVSLAFTFFIGPAVSFNPIATINCPVSIGGYLNFNVLGGTNNYFEFYNNVSVTDYVYFNANANVKFYGGAINFNTTIGTTNIGDGVGSTTVIFGNNLTSATLGSLKLNAGTLTMNMVSGSNVLINGYLNISTPSSLLNFIGSTNIFYLKGMLQNSGLINPATSTFIFNGAVSQTITGSTTFHNFTINTGSSVSVSPFNTNLTITGDWTNNGSFNHSTRTVTFNGSIPQNIGGNNTTSFFNLMLNNAAGVGLSHTEAITNNLTIASGSLKDNGYQITGSFTGLLTMAPGTLLILGAGPATMFPTNYTTANIILGTSSTVIYNSEIDQQISSIPVYENLRITSTSSASPIPLKNIPGPSATVISLLQIDANNFFGCTNNLYLRGNMINNGSHVSGSIRFNWPSTGPHIVSGNGGYYRIVVNDANGINLASNTLINYSVGFGIGNINSSNSSLLIFNIASLAIGAYDVSFVDGPVAKIGNSNFTFPVGKDQKYRPISVSNISTFTTFTAEYFHVNPLVNGYNVYSIEQPPLDHVSHCEYWTLQTLNPTTSNVTLSWDDSADNFSCGITAGDEASLRVAAWDAALSKWMDKGNTAYSVSFETVTSSLVSNFNRPFTLSSVSGNNPLPIELVSFDAKYNGKSVDINWTTASEINNAYFEIERSKDGISFTSIAKVNGANNSTSAINYYTVDENPFKGVSYYRLKQTDYDGHYSVFDPVAIRISSKEINVYPAVSSTGIFSIEGDLNEATISVYSIEGKILNCFVTSGNNDQSKVIQLPDHAQGMYFISIQSLDGLIVKKVFIM